MKSMIIVALAFVAIAVAFPVDDKDATVVNQSLDQQPDGQYNSKVETSNGITLEETGKLKEALDEDNKPHQVIVVRGSYSYLKADGTVETVEYYADETGYHARGPSVPKAERR